MKRNSAARQFDLLMIKSNGNYCRLYNHDDLCTVYSDMISDSCVQNAEQKILFNVPITVHKVHYKNKSNNSLK